MPCANAPDAKNVNYNIATRVPPTCREMSDKSGPGSLWAGITRAGVVALGLFLAACTTVQVNSDFDRSADFSSYHSFTLVSRAHPGIKNPLVAQRTYDGIQAELTRRGFTYVSDAAKADLVVDFTLGARERTDVTVHRDIDAGWWRPYWGRRVNARRYRQGTLAIDVFDAHSQRPLWHGWESRQLNRPEVERTEEAIRASVNAVLAEFPPHPTGG